MTVDPAELDLEACATEPIHIPGSIQPHGVLVALEEPSLTVARVSANAGAVLGVEPADLLGAALSDLVRLDIEALAADDLAAVNPFRAVGPAGALDGAAHRSGGFLVLELEPATDDGADPTGLHGVRTSLERLQSAGTLEELTTVAAHEVRRITGFDRVMIYRFDQHWNGEVVAEARDEALEPFLGLRYPASDIPAQARSLYARSWLRIIVDRDYEPVPIVPSGTGADGAPLDLSDSVLRSVSPVHLQYLRNMGVVTSMSVSLLDQGRLWGLISCHQYGAPLRPSLPVRTAAEFVGRTMSLLLPTAQVAGSHQRSLAIREAEGRIAERLGRTGDPAEALLGGDELLALAGASGVAVRIDGRLTTAGEVPEPEALDAIAASLLADADVAATDAHGTAQPTHAALAAGAVAVRIGSADQWLLCLRPEVVQTVTWGGDPRHRVADGEQLSPRSSFRAWTETVRGTSLPWADEEVEAVGRVARQLSTTLLRRAQTRDSVAATIQRTLLLEELPDVGGVDLCVRYRPAERDVIGGDWYDVFWLPDGRVVAAVGDVAGHGLTAAPVMSHLRHGLRAYLLKEPTPSDALTRLNELAFQLLPADLASLVVADFDPATGVLRVASAGHPPALLVHASGGDLLEGGRGPALGMVPGDVFSTAEHQLESGDLVLLYTDGVIERRDESLDVGLERLRASVPDTGVALDEACERLVGLATGDDDVTVLALRRS